jgi:hypothetical protein
MADQKLYFPDGIPSKAPSKPPAGWTRTDPEARTFTQYEYPHFDGPAVPRDVTSWHYTLTTPDGVKLLCNRSEWGYTSVHMPDDGMQTVAFGPSFPGDTPTSASDRVERGSAVYDLLVSAGEHLWYDHPAFRQRP